MVFLLCVQIQFNPFVVNLPVLCLPLLKNGAAVQEVKAFLYGDALAFKNVESMLLSANG